MPDADALFHAGFADNDRHRAAHAGESRDFFFENLELRTQDEALCFEDA